MKTITFKTGETLTSSELKQQLKDGLILHFDNDQFCEDFESDDFRCGQIELSESFGEIKFTTWFNGTINHSSIGIDSSLNNLERLCRKFGCIPTELKEEF